MLAARGLRDYMLTYASVKYGVPKDVCVLDHDVVRVGAESVPIEALAAQAKADGQELHYAQRAYGSPISAGWNVHGVRLAVNQITGEIRILQDVHAVDAGTVINPMQLRGANGGRCDAGDRLGAHRMVPAGRRGWRREREPTDVSDAHFADAPRVEVYFADVDVSAKLALRCERHGGVPDQPRCPGDRQRDCRRHRSAFPGASFTPPLIYKALNEQFNKVAAGWARFRTRFSGCVSRRR